MHELEREVKVGPRDRNHRFSVETVQTFFETSKATKRRGYTINGKTILFAPDRFRVGHNGDTEIFAYRVSDKLHPLRAFYTNSLEYAVRSANEWLADDVEKP